jgi:two-component system alkaline phosphatase synthesis response regulator PhoP
MKRVLVIEDDPDVVELLRYNLEKEDFEVDAAFDGKAGLEKIKRGSVDLLVLDLMLPQLSGIEVCKEIRKSLDIASLPVIVLTARGDETDRILGFELGADDYVTKPFSVRELVARVKALLRRSERSRELMPAAEEALVVGQLTIDPASYRVHQNGETLSLTPLEFRLLYYLASRPNRLFSRDQLLSGVWGAERYVSPRSVDAYIRRLREKIEADPVHPRYIKTLRRAGYLFETSRSGEGREP